MIVPAHSLRYIFLCWVLFPALGASPSQEEPRLRDSPGSGLRFSVTEGESDNHFIQQDGISAHLNLRTIPAPRLIVAFPAGNSGAALFFREVDDTPVWGTLTRLQTVVRSNVAGHTLHGVEADIEVRADALVLENADIGSIRFLRNAVDYSALPPREEPNVRIDGDTVRWSRERPDGQSRYIMEVQVLDGDLRTEDELTFLADDENKLAIRIVAATGDPLETPVGSGHRLTDIVEGSGALENALRFLTYETKMLAGSWRFLTYFGRDTLLSIQLLMPVLHAETAEIGLRSVLERINRDGEVAHEEEIGELAIYRNLAEHGRASAEPIYDYAMIDDNLMLAPVFRTYVATFGLERAQQLLARRTSSARTFQSQLARNLQLVVKQARPFADEPEPANLIAIKDAHNVGNWRDSQEGLVGGRYPYDVNAVLMPAALRAAAETIGSGLLDDCDCSLPDRKELLRMAEVWETNASRHFRVSVASARAREKLAAYARANGYPRAGLPEEDVAFLAVALDARFDPIPVMHSDIGMDLLFLDRPARQLDAVVSNLVRPFPAGLATPVGVVAANPAFAAAGQQALVTRDHYHGTVVWSWQQAMMVAGLDRQLRRDDLAQPLRNKLAAARRQIWRSITASKEIINSELWSFAVRDGAFVIEPFGQSEDHLTESNAVQLWSTVFLALPGEHENL